jgi:uncharacterized surface protein with fasciclin (FAS1) repeats
MRFKIAMVAMALVLMPVMALASSHSKDIVDTAVAAGQFKTLTSLLTKANLVEELKKPGPFTVFAPNDAAFAKVPAKTMEQLGKDPALLKQVLLYHVVPGKYMAKDLVNLTTVKTLSPKDHGRASLNLTVGKGKLISVDGAKPIKTDILASNGVIHVIDAVMIPPILKYE